MEKEKGLTEMVNTVVTCPKCNSGEDILIYENGDLPISYQTKCFWCGYIYKQEDLTN